MRQSMGQLYAGRPLSQHPMVRLFQEVVMVVDATHSSGCIEEPDMLVLCAGLKIAWMRALQLNVPLDPDLMGDFAIRIGEACGGPEVLCAPHECMHPETLYLLDLTQLPSTQDPHTP
jgi:hypothetical protein